MEKQTMILILLVITSTSVPILSYLKDYISNKDQTKKHIELITKLAATEKEVANTKLELAEFKSKAYLKFDKTLALLTEQHKITPEIAKEIKHTYVEVVGASANVGAGVVDVKIEK